MTTIPSGVTAKRVARHLTLITRSLVISHNRMKDQSSVNHEVELANLQNWEQCTIPLELVGEEVLQKTFHKAKSNNLRYYWKKCYNLDKLFFITNNQGILLFTTLNLMNITMVSAFLTCPNFLQAVRMFRIRRYWSEYYVRFSLHCTLRRWKLLSAIITSNSAFLSFDKFSVWCKLDMSRKSGSRWAYLKKILLI